MRHLTTLELSKLKILSENAIEVALIEPTTTGLAKSILDATGPVREFLKKSKIHDYSIQLQGKNHKVQLEANLIEPNGVIKSIASLYRPETKKGDPRIWFKRLPSFCKPNDLLGLIAYKGGLSVVNLTRHNIIGLVNSTRNNPLLELVTEINRQSNQIADELLFKLKEIAKRGFVPSLLTADTSVGRTLEYLLGININSSKQPDYKGIELKSFRQKKSNRKTLFAQVPDWSLSKFKSSAEILINFGYKRHTDLKLYCTVSTRSYNSQGLILRLDKTLNYLIENSAAHGDFAIWHLKSLHKRLEEKHSETFWIGVESKFSDGKEYFRYNKVEHTHKPLK
jgi:hypothetical protein